MFHIRQSGTVISSLVAVVLAASLAACGSGGDGDASDLGSFWVATDIAAADLDSDGRTDVVSVAMLANSGQGQGYLRVYRQTSSWGFAFSQYLVGTYPWRVKIADIDGDGAADLLILDVGRSGASPGMVWLIRQDRRNRGVFLAPEVVVAGLPSTYDFTVIDANLDGAPDIVLASGIGGSDGAALLLQDPSQRGTFRPATLITFPGKPQAVGMGDLNGDGLPDLAFYATTSFSVNTGSTGHFVIVHAQKIGGFGPPTVLFPQIGVNAQLMQVGDANGDGRPDVLSVFTPFSTNFAAKLTVAVQSAPGSYVGADTALSPIRGLDGFVVADLNRDRMADVATTGFYPTGSPTVVRAQTSVLLPIGGGAYGIAAIYEMPITTESITAADLDGDGLSDLILQGGDNQAFVMQQSPASAGVFLPPRAL
jgi:hypothetical protein